MGRRLLGRGFDGRGSALPPRAGADPRRRRLRRRAAPRRAHRARARLVRWPHLRHARGRGGPRRGDRLRRGDGAGPPGGRGAARRARVRRLYLGVLPAQRLAQTRLGARGALLFHACLPVSEFGPSWPAGVSAQVHTMEADPEFDNGWDLPAARALVEEAEDGELFLYPGDQHLFADSSLSSYDADAAELLNRRVLSFLASIDRARPA